LAADRQDLRLPGFRHRDCPGPGHFRGDGDPADY